VSVLEADLLVSMPKIKTHHWAGVTLSLKNIFGIVPGQKYGWPKIPSIGTVPPKASVMSARLSRFIS